MIHIFRTTVENPEHVEKLGSELNSILGESVEWNFDLEDCDRILRVVSGEHNTIELCKTVLQSNGFLCEELPDN